MYTSIIKLLKANEYHGVSFNIERAKGHHEIPSGWKDFFKQFKRIINGKRYKL